MVFLTSKEYEELLEYKFKYELERERTSMKVCDCEKTVEEVEEESRDFKVGDRVKLLSIKQGFRNWFTCDDVCEITGVFDNTYDLKNESGYLYTAKKEDLKLIEEREEN